jgi:glycolate oxidase
MEDYAKVTPEILTALESVVGVRNVSTDREKREVYSYDEVNRGYWDGEYVAEVVVFPESPEHVAAVLALANERRIPVTPRGAGTGLSGGAVPLHRGIVLSFEKMNRILELDTDNLTITVEPGIVTAEITKAARAAGLLYAGDPCSGDASFIGGNVAENAGGNKVVKYGSTGASVLALEAVLPDGSVTWFGGKRRKDVTGYDFVHLLVGSEGTLAVVTKIVLKLLPLPARVVDLLIPFSDTESAVSSFPDSPGGEGGAVLHRVHGQDLHSPCPALSEHSSSPRRRGSASHRPARRNDPKMLADEYERVGDLCFAHGALEVFVADNRNVRDKLWKARKCLAEAIMAFSAHSCLEDIAVPSSAVPELMRRTAAITDRWGIEGVHFGHIGDGNMHINFMLPEKRSDWHDLFCGALRELYAAARDLGGRFRASTASD